MFIYAFIHLHMNILKPSQCLDLILRQLFCINFSTRIQSSQFKSHSTCFFRYTCIYIYTISNKHFKAFTVSTVATSTGLCATCTCQETCTSFCVLTCTRARSRDLFISMHGMFECEQYWNQIYTCVSLRSVIMHSKYRIMLLLPPPFHTCFIYQVSTLFLIYKYALRKIGNTCSCAVFQQQIQSHCHLLRNQSQSCIL